MLIPTSKNRTFSELFTRWIFFGFLNEPYKFFSYDRAKYDEVFQIYKLRGIPILEYPKPPPEIENPQPDEENNNDRHKNEQGEGQESNENEQEENQSDKDEKEGNNKENE